MLERLHAHTRTLAHARTLTHPTHARARGSRKCAYVLADMESSPCFGAGGTVRRTRTRTRTSRDEDETPRSVRDKRAPPPQKSCSNEMPESQEAAAHLWNVRIRLIETGWFRFPVLMEADKHLQYLHLTGVALCVYMRRRNTSAGGR